MAYPESTIQRLVGVFATLDPTSPNYLKGAALVDFFNSLGFADAYVFSDGKGIVTPDAGESLSRRKYVIARLTALNNNEKLDQAIQRFIETSNQPELAEKNINEALNGTGKVFVSHSYRMKDNVLAAIKEEMDQQETSSGRLCVSLSQEEKLNNANKVKQQLMDETLGVIPSDRIVVFISYSWDSLDHQKWVTSFADKLTGNGFYVLFDKYNESGTPLELFMELGLERADKVIVVGTPLYKIKSLTLSGGASYEGAIIRNSLFQDIGTKKFVPCLKEGTFTESLPSPISGRTGVDFSNDDAFEAKFKELCEAILSRPAHQRPALGPNPLYENKAVKDEDELKYTDFRHDNDVKWLTTLFSNISIPRIERYLERSPETVEDIVFESHDIWNRILNTMTFRIFQENLRGLIMDFYSTWDEIVRLGFNYYGPSNIPNYFKFYGYAADVFQSPKHEKAFFDICKKIDEMKEKLTKLVNYILDNYEIDLDVLSHQFEQSVR